jgi:RNA polymerase sigma factor (sigma-70 family)
MLPEEKPREEEPREPKPAEAHDEEPGAADEEKDPDSDEVLEARLAGEEAASGAAAEKEEEGEEFELPPGFLEGDTEELVKRAQAGDSSALDTLFARYHGTVMDAARRGLGPRLRLKESPEDLAQTTFREATRDFPRYEFRGNDSLVRWLVRILQNKIRDKAEFYSARKRDVSRERAMHGVGGKADPDRSYDPPSTDLSVTRKVVRQEEVAILSDALQHLSPDHRKAIALVFFQGMTLREAGQHMNGRTEDAVRMLLRRAEGRLRELTKARLDRGE